MLQAYKKNILLDDDYKGLLLSYSWGLDSDGYPKAKIDGKHIRLHQVVLGRAPKGSVIDHINGDKLDNRRINLRVVSYRDNALNSTKQGDGVWWNKSKNRWQSQHKVNGVRHYIGTFKTKEEALAAYSKYATHLLKLLKETK